MEKEVNNLKTYQEALKVVVPSTADEVMSMFGLCAVIEMQVINFNLLPEREQRLIYEIYGKQIVCKKPIADSENMMFYMATRTSEMGALLNELCEVFEYDAVDVYFNMVVRPNKQNRMPNVNCSIR